MLTTLLGQLLAPLDCCPWGGAAGRQIVAPAVRQHIAERKAQLYTRDERLRRDSTRWTLVQGVLAPVQFLVFLVSLALVLRTLATGEGAGVAAASVVVKTGVLYLIMITGSIWEKAVFGRYLFAPAFYWEDAVSMVVIALHTAYVVALFTGALGTHALLMLALAAYATYLVNAAQFLFKLRAARREETRWAPAGFGQSA